MLDEFEWDPAKARSNERKHGVDFADAVAVFFDERALSEFDKSSAPEERWIVVGMDARGRVLLVAYTLRGQRIRLISARSATAHERRSYTRESR